MLAREHGYPGWPALVHQLAEQPFRTDLHYYEGRAYGIATVDGVWLAAARRDLARQHGVSSWAELTRVQALADRTEPPISFVLVYRALESRDTESLRALLDEHPELVPQRGTNGNDLLGMAGDLDAVRLLLERGADVNRGNDHGWTKPHSAGSALVWAAANGRVAAIRRHVELGAGVNGRSTFGGPGHGRDVTALHLAAQSGRADAVDVLLELGADPTIRDGLHGGTAAGWAQHGGHPELAARLG